MCADLLWVLFQHVTWKNCDVVTDGDLKVGIPIRYILCLNLPQFTDLFESYNTRYVVEGSPISSNMGKVCIPIFFRTSRLDIVL